MHLTFIAHGSLTEPGRSSSLEITCPGPEAALALVGAARRMGIVAKAREVRGVDRVVIRDGDAIGVLLTRLGAHESVLAWEERRMRREVRAGEYSRCIITCRHHHDCHRKLSCGARQCEPSGPWETAGYLIAWHALDQETHKGRDTQPTVEQTRAWLVSQGHV